MKVDYVEEPRPGKEATSVDEIRAAEMLSASRIFASGIGLFMALAGVVAMGWALWDMGARFVAWLRFGVPMESPDTIITFLASRGVEWAINPHDWIKVHEILSGISLSFAALFIGGAIMVWGLSIADKPIKADLARRKVT